jgi:carbamoyl-phosphate synthase small subunit
MERSLKSRSDSWEKVGELVFNTSMAGYQEILTDPSYKGQIVIMTYPLIGNYGINEEDIESQAPKVEGFIVKENSTLFSNWRGHKGLSDYLMAHRIMGIEGMDTRALTKHIRTAGAMKAILSTEDGDRDRLIQKAKASPGLIGRDLVKEVTCQKPFPWTGTSDPQFLGPDLRLSGPQSRFKVVVLDYGVKYNILPPRRWTVVVALPVRSQLWLFFPSDGILLSMGQGPRGLP